MVYDGIQEDRQQKTARISRDLCRDDPGLNLLICAAPQEEGNCSVCEKCCRTMTGLALNGIEPGMHGFLTDSSTPKRIRDCLEQSRWEMAFSTFWREIQLKVPDCRSQALPEWGPFFDWFADADLDRYLRNRPTPLWQEERRWIKSRLPVDWLRWLRKMKFALKGSKVGSG